jgi:hypothetical protein
VNSDATDGSADHVTVKRHVHHLISKMYLYNNVVLAMTMPLYGIVIANTTWHSHC